MKKFLNGCDDGHFEISHSSKFAYFIINTSMTCRLTYYGSTQHRNPLYCHAEQECVRSYRSLPLTTLHMSLHYTCHYITHVTTHTSLHYTCHYITHVTTLHMSLHYTCHYITHVFTGSKHSSGYDPQHRNPLYCHAEQECVWELQKLASHYITHVTTLHMYLPLTTLHM